MTNAHKNIKAIVNGHTYSDLKADKDGFYLDDQKHHWDIAKLPDGRFHMIIDGENRLAEVLEANLDKKSFRIKIDTGIYEVQLIDQFDELLQKMGMASLNKSTIKSIKAPMPGMIVEISVKDGETVEKGDTLLILKAMKMENMIKSPRSAKISKILINKGQAVEKNQDLILF